MAERRKQEAQARAAAAVADAMVSASPMHVLCCAGCPAQGTMRVVLGATEALERWSGVCHALCASLDADVVVQCLSQTEHVTIAVLQCGTVT